MNSPTSSSATSSATAKSRRPPTSKSSNFGEGRMLRIKSRQNFWAGVFFLACGAFETTMALQYDVGNPAAMGPGFMPVLLGIALAFLGLIILIGGLSVAGPAIEPGHWRPVVCIIAALVLFALLINK